MEGKQQVCATLPLELISEVNEEAKFNDRSLSQMIAILLQQALREKKRKRNAAKKDTL